MEDLISWFDEELIATGPMDWQLAVVAIGLMLAFGATVLALVP